MDIGGTVSGTGTVALQPYTAGNAIDVGSTTDAQAGTLEVSAAELSRVSAPTLQVGRSDGTGTLSVTSSLGNSNLNANTVRLLDANIALNSPISMLRTSSATFEATATNAVTLGSTLSVESTTGSATVNITGTSITANNANLSANASSGGGAGIHPANVNITAGAGGINWTGGSITASGGSDAVPLNKDDANISLQATGPVSVANTTFTASGCNPDIDIFGSGSVPVT